MGRSNRRNFLKKLALSSASIPLLGFEGGELPHSFIREEFKSLINKLEDAEYWDGIRKQYTLSSEIINMNNGGCSPQPKIVQETFNLYNKLSNEVPSYYMWRILDKNRLHLKKKLAHFSGCSHEDIAINRNTTEALETIIFGLDLKKGDEVVLSKYDYPHMMFAWQQREKRDGIVLRYVDFDFPEENNDILVKKYTDLFNERTKLVHITHMINYTGQIVPVREISDVAKQFGIEVLVDAAHTFSQINKKISDLNCDYYGTSLHKWLCAPFGTGMIYIHKDKRQKIWPLLANENPRDNKVEKFEALGTRSFSAEFAVESAVDFNTIIGVDKKEDRLRFLKNYWLKKVSKMKNIETYTSLERNFSCALATIGVKKQDPNELEKYLFNKYKIHTTTIEYLNVHGVRITPHIYTSIKELDLLVKGIKEFVQ